MSTETKTSSISVRTICLVGLLTAAVFVFSQISIPIPAIMGISRIHLGNGFCLLAGFVLGGWQGGFAAGLGSAFYDLTNPIFVPSAPFTFFSKFMMAFVAGKISRAGVPSKQRDLVAAASGALTYVVLYLGKNFLEDTLFLRTEVGTALADVAIKAGSSLTNAAIAVVIVLVLAPVVKKVLAGTRLA